jgi:tetratricopeptide (TPR) repeat protein
MKKNITLFSILFFAFSSIAFANIIEDKITTEDCKACDLDCPKHFEPSTLHIVIDGGVKKKLMVFFDYENAGAQNSDIIVFLYDGMTCRAVLNGAGSGVSFEEKPKTIYPEIITYWHMSASEGIRTRYVWNGKEYVSNQLEKSERLNKEALEYFKKGNLDRAIKIWEKAKELSIIPGLGFTSNAEVLNNLGFAYYTLAKNTKSDKHYELALYYLDETVQVDSSRWEAYLNLGDLYSEIDNPKHALQSYEKLLKLNPNYKYANKIREKILTLRKKAKGRDN